MPQTDDSFFSDCIGIEVREAGTPEYRILLRFIRMYIVATGSLE